MPAPTPHFPAFDVWQSMSETEQDALIARLEVRTRRMALAKRLLLGLLGVTVLSAFACGLVRF